MAARSSDELDGTIASAAPIAPGQEEIDRLGRALEETRAVLAEQSHRLRLAVDAARIIAWEIDLQTGEVRYEANPEVLRENQFFPENLPRTISNWLAMVHPDDRSRADANFRRTLKELSPYDDEFRVVLASDATHWIAARGNVYLDEQGKHPRLIGVVIDVTERRMAEQRLRERDATLRAVLEASPDLINVLDADGTVLLASPSAQKITGYAPAQPQGQSTLQWIHPDDRGLAIQAMRAVLTGNAAESQARFRYRHADGHWVVLEAHGRPTFDASGRPTGIVTVSRDVTDQVRLENELTQAKNEAEKANRAKSEFLSRMSHELRTPLNAILGFAQLLELESAEPMTRESGDQIVRAGRHLLRLINEVLDISRIEAGKLTLAPEPLCAADVMEEALQLIRPIAAQRGIVVTAELEAARSLHVLADRHRLIQVLLNLLANAVKYNRDAGSVRFETRIVDGRLHFEIEDTGHGIPAHKLDLLFTPFERLGAEQSTIEGTGIGLALAKSLVEAMGGSIGVRSAIGQGSCFWIDLPVADRLPCVTPDSREAARAVGAESTGAPVPTVLYVEDNLSNFRLVERILSHRPGVRLMTAVRGGLGLELAAQHRPDLILLDLQLPDLSGEEVLRRLQQDPRTSDIPVIMISADATEAHIDGLRNAGARDYLTKPLDVKRFLEVLDEHLVGAG